MKFTKLSSVFPPVLFGHGKEALEYLKIVLFIPSCVISVIVLIPVSLSFVMCVYSVMMYCHQFVCCVEMFTGKVLENATALGKRTRVLHKQFYIIVPIH